MCLPSLIMTKETKTNPFPHGFYTLVITEKPSVAKQLANVLGAYLRKDGYFEGKEIRISWCLGHLCQMAPPEVYDPNLKKWDLNVLPILPKSWKRTCGSSRAIR